MINKALDTQWKVFNEIWRLLIFPAVRFLFAINRIPWKTGWRFYGIPVIQKHRQSQISIETGLDLRSSVRSNPLGPYHPVILSTREKGACIVIGSNFGMTGGTLCAADSITIGNNVAIGANCTVVDTDFHPLNPEARLINGNAGEARPIVIEDNVFIGMNCLVLKGVTIGEGSVIGAGSVVTKNIPPRCIAAGNPAKFIRSLETNENAPA